MNLTIGYKGHDPILAELSNSRFELTELWIKWIVEEKRNNSATMISLVNSTKNELALFAAMELEDETKGFILPYSIEQHMNTFSQSEIGYLTVREGKNKWGFIIFACEAHNSVELRRIVITRRGCGIGKKAILTFLDYCRDSLQAKRVWLDVFEENYRARHVYSQIGFISFGESSFEKQPLQLMEILL